MATSVESQPSAGGNNTTQSSADDAGVSTDMYLCNLQWDVEIFDLLKDYKLQPDGINIAENKGNGKSMGYASIRFESVNEAKKAVTELNGRDLYGKKLVLVNSNSYNVPSVDDKDDNKNNAAQMQAQPSSQPTGGGSNPMMPAMNMMRPMMPHVQQAMYMQGYPYNMSLLQQQQFMQQMYSNPAYTSRIQMAQGIAPGLAPGIAPLSAGAPGVAQPPSAPSTQPDKPSEKKRETDNDVVDESIKKHENDEVKNREENDRSRKDRDRSHGRDHRHRSRDRDHSRERSRSHRDDRDHHRSSDRDRDRERDRRR